MLDLTLRIRSGLAYTEAYEMILLHNASDEALATERENE